MNNKFYCYSAKMSYFIRAFDIRYIEIGFNAKTKTRYHIFEKSEKLDKEKIYKEYEKTWFAKLEKNKEGF